MIVFMFICACNCGADVRLPDSTEDACKCMFLLCVGVYVKCFLRAVEQQYVLLCYGFLHTRDGSQNVIQVEFYHETSLCKQLPMCLYLCKMAEITVIILGTFPVKAHIN